MKSPRKLLVKVLWDIYDEIIRPSSDVWTEANEVYMAESVSSLHTHKFPGVDLTHPVLWQKCIPFLSNIFGGCL